jgi:hypothetical protein
MEAEKCQDRQLDNIISTFEDRDMKTLVLERNVENLLQDVVNSFQNFKMKPI